MPLEQEAYQLASQISRVESLDAGGQLFNTKYLEWEEDRQDAIKDLVEYAEEHDVLEDPDAFGVALSESRYDDAYELVLGKVTG